MNHKFLRMILAVGFTSIMILTLLGSVQAEAAMLADPPYPAPGGNNAIDDGGNTSRAGGITYTIGGFDFNAFDQLYYGVGRYDPWPTFFAGGPELTMDGSKDILLFNSELSDFPNGIVVWTGETTLRWLPPTGTWTDSTLDTRFTLTITDIFNEPLALTAATFVPGVPSDLGAVLEIEGAFKAKWLFEAEAPDTNNFEPALDLFDRLHTDPDFQLVTSVGGAFYFTPPICVGDHDNDNDVDGSDLAVQATGGTDVELEDFAANFGKPDCSQAT